jgi:ABC-type anion transport system duplicated permease subunit
MISRRHLLIKCWIGMDNSIAKNCSRLTCISAAIWTVLSNVFTIHLSKGAKKNMLKPLILTQHVMMRDWRWEWLKKNQRTKLLELVSLCRATARIRRREQANSRNVKRRRRKRKNVNNRIRRILRLVRKTYLTSSLLLQLMHPNCPWWTTFQLYILLLQLIKIYIHRLIN